jgi:ADP-ribosylglycohydrolase
MSCLIYLKIAEKILEGINKRETYNQTRKDISQFWENIRFPLEERKHFNKLIQNDILDTPKDELLSGGYVIEVLESSIWFFLQTDNYRDSILGIINLGHDTDTSAAITGGLSGLYYGIDGIPGYWVNTIARKKDIIKLCEDLNQKF